jgi:hypothetical protein
MMNMWMHDVSERFKIRRKTLAKDAGLDQSYDVGTYPSEQTTVVVSESGISKALIAGMMLVTGGAGGVGLTTLLSASPAAVDRVPAVSPAIPVEFDVTIEEVDGRPVITNVKGVGDGKSKLHPDP